MNLDMPVKKSVAIKYGFNEVVSKETVMRKIRLLRPKDWGVVINVASNSRISKDTGFLLASMMNVGTTQAHWCKDRNNLFALCKQIKKQSSLEKRVKDIIEDFDNKYTKAIKEVYYNHRTHKDVAAELGVEVKEIPEFIAGFFYSINFSEFYSWIIEGSTVTSSRELLMEIPDLKPGTVMRLGSMGFAYVDEVQTTLSGAVTVEDGINELSKYCGCRNKTLRELVENLVEAKIVDLVNLKNNEVRDNHEYDENKPYAILSKSVFVDGRMTVETYMIRNLQMNNKALQKAINELVLDDESKRLDSVRHHNNDYLGRPIYEIVCSSINWDT